MKDEVNRALDIEKVSHVIFDEMEPRMTEEMGYVVRCPSDKAIQSYHFVPFLNKPIAEVRA